MVSSRKLQRITFKCEATRLEKRKTKIAGNSLGDFAEDETCSL